MKFNYEIIVVGGGHAGCEAALSSSRKGHSTLLVTGNLKNVADMPCNPSIGGSAKGIIVREIDALGGEMGINADKTLIQMKMLNSSKGPSVHSLRAQADKITYPKEMLKTLQNQDNLTLLEAMVEDLIVENNTVKGVILADGTKINSNITLFKPFLLNLLYDLSHFIIPKVPSAWILLFIQSGASWIDIVDIFH